jgi:acetolactate synthase-1/2/3 large subunit
MVQKVVASVGSNDGMRSILALFEGVATGAADGYGRMLGKPACTLLHLGPGLSNGLANLHNARRAGTPVINIIGDHATYHQRFDAPLASDIHSLANPVSGWVKSSADAKSLPADGVESVTAALQLNGQVATLVVPANCAWDESIEPLPKAEKPVPNAFDAASVREAARKLSAGKSSTLFMNGDALSQRGLELADQISQQSGCRLICSTFSTKIRRGEGSVKIERLGYFAEQAEEQLAGIEEMILVGTGAPVAFFAYPGKSSEFTPEGCSVHELASADQDLVGALEALVREMGAESLSPRLQKFQSPGLANGDLTPEAVGRAIIEYMPEESIVVDESATSGLGTFELSDNARSHDWILLTGGSIGFGLPCALGASVACPDRKVVCLHGDGGAMYTIQALWTMAREELDVVTVVFSNRKYLILQIELARVGAQTMNKKTLDMLDLTHPDLDFVKMSEGMGVPATRATTAEEFNEQFEQAINTKGPRLIEVIL